MSRIIEPDAIIASDETRRSGRPMHYGKKRDTRKNPHAIAVGFDLD
jgi:hypothetical protein